MLLGKYNASDYRRPDSSGGLSELTLRVDGHTNHCFDYIRQGIQCAGDMTLEGPNRGINSGIIGDRTAHHSCRSWVSLINMSWLGLRLIVLVE